MKNVNIMSESDRLSLNFEYEVRNWFSFLGNIGFREVEALPTIVRFRNDGIEVDVYHGRLSYEIGAGFTIFGTRYALSEIIRATDLETAKQYHNSMATTPEAVTNSIKNLSLLTKRYCNQLFSGDLQFISTLEKQRKAWADEYALNTLADQLRPQADDAFRRKEYSTAAKLFSRIQQSLSPSELKKLSFAKKHSLEGSKKKPGPG
jgi:hypothetical protein